MSFADAVRTCLTKYATFSGRARRSEYWWFFLFNILVSIAAGIIDAILRTRAGGLGLVGTVAALALLLPGLAVGVRRLHDTGRTGWWLLIGLIPCVGFVVLLIFFLSDSQPDNAYGASPKGGMGAGPGGPYGGAPPNPYGQAPGAPPSNPYA